MVVIQTIARGALELKLFTVGGMEAMMAGSTSPGKATQEMPKEIAPPTAFRSTHDSSTQRATK